MSIVELKEISKIYYPGKLPAVALENISFKVRKGDFMAIAGPSGSGKSSLLNIIGLIDEPTGGSLFIDSKEIMHKNEKELTKLRKEHLGFVFQSFNLVPTLTVFENVEYPLLNTIPDRKLRKEIIQKTLADVELAEFADRYPAEISGGQQQRVSIARAVAKNPVIVLADEPTANLDSKTGSAILKLMKKMNKDKRTTFILASHDPNVLSIAHTKIFLKDGRMENAARQKKKGV